MPRKAKQTGVAENPFAEVAERLRKDAYDAGWNDAMAAIRSAMEGNRSVATPARRGRRPKASAPAAQTSRQATAANPPGRKGSVPARVYQMVAGKPGIATRDIVAAMKGAAREPTVRIALSRLSKRKLIANRRRQWFPQ